MSELEIGRKPHRLPELRNLEHAEPRLTAMAERLQTAVAAHDQAVAANDEAFRLELRRRDEHARALDELMGRVRAAFPMDRPQQDAVFPAPESSSSKKDDEAVEEVGAPDASVAPTAPVSLDTP